MENRKNQIKVGIIVTLALLSLFALFIYVGKSGITASGQNYILQFKYLNDLKKGASVRFSGGINCGTVTNMVPGEELALVYVWIDDTIKVTNKTKFSIQTAGLLGEKYMLVEYTLDDKNAKALPSGSLIKGVEPVNIDKALKDAQTILDKAMDFINDDSSMISQDNVGSIFALVANINELVTETRGLLDGKNELVEDTAKKLNLTLTQATYMILQVRRLILKTDKIVNDLDRVDFVKTVDKIDTILNKTDESIDKIIGGADKSLVNANKVILAMNKRLSKLLVETNDKINVMNKEVLTLMNFGKNKLKNTFEGENGIETVQKESRDIMLKLNNKMEKTFNKMDTLFDRTEKVFQRTNVLLTNIERLLKSNDNVVGLLLNDKNGAKKLKEILDNLEVITKEIRKSPFIEGNDKKYKEY